MTKCGQKKKQKNIGSQFNFYFPTDALSNTNATFRLNKTKKRNPICKLKKVRGFQKFYFLGLTCAVTFKLSQNGKRFTQL